MLTGVVSLIHSHNKKVASSAVQTPPDGSGFDTFEFWLPERRPHGKLLAASFHPSLKSFGVEQIKTGYTRPFIQSNAWVMDKDDHNPTVTLTWDKQQTIRRMQLFFDVDYDHAMESVQFGHYDSAMPFCVKAFRIVDDKNNVIASEPDNHQAMYEIRFDKPVATTTLRIELLETRTAPAALFGVRCYG
jgi:hypothetical protein